MSVAYSTMIDRALLPGYAPFLCFFVEVNKPWFPWNVHPAQETQTRHAGGNCIDRGRCKGIEQKLQHCINVAEWSLCTARPESRPDGEHTAMWSVDPQGEVHRR